MHPFFVCFFFRNKKNEKRHCQRCVRRKYASLGRERELAVGPVYFFKHELENPKDCNAVAVFQDRDFQHKRCYLRRPDAFVVAKLFRKNLIQGLCDMKVKGPVARWSRQTCPQQKCKFGFRCIDTPDIIH